jgi:tetratricopeptide (TPR) repeat protein
MCRAGFLLMLLLAAGLGAQEQPTPSEEEALQAFRQGSFSRAVQLYEKALTETTNPQHRAELHVQIAWTLFALVRIDEADTHLQAALVETPAMTLMPEYYTQEFLDLFEEVKRKALAGPEAPPPDPEITILAIRHRVEGGGDVRAALADVNLLIKSYPEDGRLIPLKIDLLERLGRTEEADQLRHLIEAGPAETYMDQISVPEAIYQADQLLADGEIELSLELLRDAVAREPGNIAVLELMAQAASRAGNWSEAKAALRNAIGLQPNELNFRLSLGEVYLATDKLSAARDEFHRITESDPQSDRAWAALGLLDARLGRKDRAIEELAKALSENPLLPEAQLAYGELLLEESKVDKALENLRTVHKALQDDSQTAARLGQALLARGSYQEALAHLRTAVDGGFEPDDVRRSLALAFITNGELSEAQRVLDKVGDNEAWDAEILRSMVKLERQEPVEAEAIIANVAEKRSNDPAVLNILAKALYQQARYEEAVSYLMRAKELAPNDAQVNTNLNLAEAALAAEKLRQNAQPTVAAATH